MGIIAEKFHICHDIGTHLALFWRCFGVRLSLFWRSIVVDLAL